MKIDISKYSIVYIDKVEDPNLPFVDIGKYLKADLVLRKLPSMKDGEYFILKNRYGEKYKIVAFTKAEEFLLNL